MPEPRTLHVVDAQDSGRVDLMRRLALEGHEVRTFASVGEYVRARAERADCIFAGISAADSETLALGCAERNDMARTPIVYLATSADIPLAVSAMKAGAFDFLMLPLAEPVLAELLERALQAADAWQAEFMLRNRAAVLLRRLTPRERTIFAHILRGERNKQIASALQSQEATVKVHRSRLMRKLEARTLAELLHIGREVEALLADDDDPPPAPAGRVASTPAATRARPVLAGAAILTAHAEQRRAAGMRPSSWAGLYLR